MAPSRGKQALLIGSLFALVGCSYEFNFRMLNLDLDNVSSFGNDKDFQIIQVNDKLIWGAPDSGDLYTYELYKNGTAFTSTLQCSYDLSSDSDKEGDKFSVVAVSSTGIKTTSKKTKIKAYSAIPSRSEADIRFVGWANPDLDLCMAVSGKCYMSLDNTGRSANRGACMQICRRSYIVTDRETGTELEIDNKYIMSPKDLKTIRFIDKMMTAGVRVFKIEGRARGPEYVLTVVQCYKEAIRSVLDGTFTEEKKDQWDERLATVFNRGFWDGYYQGQLLGEWNSNYGSNATERKQYIGKGVKYFSKLGVAEFTVEADTFSVGDKMLITGPTTGALYVTVDEIHDDVQAVQTAQQGTRVSIKVPEKVRPSDKLFKLIKS